MQRQKEMHSSNSAILTRRNVRLAREKWGAMLSPALTQALRLYSEQLDVSIEHGDLLLMSDKWYVTHSGLLRLAKKNHCSGIQTETVSEFCDPVTKRWVVRAIVYKTSRSKGFVGYGDADPTNVSPLVRGAEMRIAETRAVNRTLRKAYGIGLCSIEEIGTLPRPFPVAADQATSEELQPGNGNLLRDRLRLLIRQHQLDAGQVKRYAAYFCGTKELRDASREQVEKLIDHLSQLAAAGGDKLREELATYENRPVVGCRNATNETVAPREVA